MLNIVKVWMLLTGFLTPRRVKSLTTAAGRPRSARVTQVAPVQHAGPPIVQALPMQVACLGRTSEAPAMQAKATKMRLSFGSCIMVMLPVRMIVLWLGWVSRIYTFGL